MDSMIWNWYVNPVDLAAILPLVALPTATCALGVVDLSFSFRAWS